MAATKVYIPHLVFTGDAFLKEHAVIVEDGSIKAVLPVSAMDKNTPAEHFPESILVPAFIDLQIYGAFEKLFSVYPAKESLNLLNKYCKEGGTAFCMPTVATNETNVFYRSIDAIKDYWKEGGDGILGLHIEGPWINKVKRGAHVESLIHSPTIEEAEALLAYGKGIIKIITLAPEVCSQAVIGLIRSYDVKIFAGHSNAGYEEAMQGFNNGISSVTHLYNAMSPLQHRSPGLVGAAFDHQTIMASIIADGYHVDYAAVRIAKKIMKERLFAITDAVTTTNDGYYQHLPKGDKYTADGILSGSALTMYKALQNLVDHCGIELDEALRMCSLYPARVMQMDTKLGRIAKGHEAKLALVPVDLHNGNAQLLPF